MCFLFRCYSEPKPAYFRVKVWRRLQGIGAVAVKSTVYALPAPPYCLPRKIAPAFRLPKKLAPVVMAPPRTGQEP